MYIGEIERIDVGVRLEERYMRVLGVYLGVDSIEARDVTWAGVINKIRTICTHGEGEN